MNIQSSAINIHLLNWDQFLIPIIRTRNKEKYQEIFFKFRFEVLEDTLLGEAVSFSSLIKEYNSS